jgi:hypothetical protein
MFCSFFVVIVVLCIFIFVCTSVGLLPPGERPIAVSNNHINNLKSFVPVLVILHILYANNKLYHIEHLHVNI